MTDTTPDVVIYYLDRANELTAPDPKVITRSWLEQKLGSTHLEAIPCVEDHLTDDHYQSLFYLLVDADGYTHDRPRNEAVEEALGETVRIHTRNPTEDEPWAWMGLYGPAILLPRSLVPPDTWPRFNLPSHVPDTQQTS